MGSNNRKRKGYQPHHSNKSKKSFHSRQRVQLLKDGHVSTIDEPSVGIKMFLGDESKTFSGLVKKRYTDFLVNEIGLNNEVATLKKVPYPRSKTKNANSLLYHITSYLPKTSDENKPLHFIGKFIKTKINDLNERSNNKNQGQKILSFVEVLDNLYGKDISRSFSEFYRMLDVEAKEEDRKNEKFILPPSGKMYRKQVHEAIREYVPSLFIAEMIKEDEKQIDLNTSSSTSPFQIRTASAKEIRESNSRIKETDQKDYLQFILYKENQDTSNVMNTLSKLLYIPLKNLTYAGTKDKRGCTTQFVHVSRVNKERLTLLNDKFKNSNQSLILSDFKYVSNPLSLGDLNGNEFHLAIRDLKGDDDELKKTIDHIKEYGFINYFGLQRFGTTDLATHEIGKLVLQKRYKELIDLLLVKKRDSESDEMWSIRQSFEQNQDIDQALEAFPMCLIAERSLLEGMKIHEKNNYRQILSCIPPKLRMIYTHAYQSWIWNEAVSHRMKIYSKTRIVVGDLVCIHPVSSKDKVKDMEVHVVNQQDIDNNNFQITDVVLPLPGFDVKYPQNEVQSVYQNIFDKDGIDFSKEDRTTVEMHLSGGYRKIIQKAVNVSYEIVRYDDADQQLLVTQKDLFEGKTVKSFNHDGTYKALCIKFQLNAGSYATMFIRELLKQTSDMKKQLTLNQDDLKNVQMIP